MEDATIEEEDKNEEIPLQSEEEKQTAANEPEKVEEGEAEVPGEGAEGEEAPEPAKEEEAQNEEVKEIDDTPISIEEAEEILKKPELKRIDNKKVEATWLRIRGPDAKGPSHDMITKAIAMSDKNKDSKLQDDEMQRLTIAFIQHGGDANLTNEKLHKILDENADGKLTFHEVMTTFKVMWLMKKNGVKLEDLLQD